MRDPIVVVGGGPAGLMAAGRAAELGAPVLLIEKTNRLGSKLRITGKGRCNLTNDCDIQEFLAHLGPNGVFMRNALARFSVQDLIAFFQARGVPTITERGRRVFPVSSSAGDVARAMRAYCVASGVRFRYNAPVSEILLADSKVYGVRTRERVTKSSSVILATGGLSYPQTGSTGDGYTMARHLGHTVTPLRPGLVPLMTAEDFVARLQGLSLRNVRATLYQGQRRLASAFGEMLFTHFGVSGPIILTLSSSLGDALDRGPVQLRIDLKPALDKAILDRRLLRDLAKSGTATYHSLLKGLLPRSLIDVFIERTGIPGDQRLSQFRAEQRQRVLRLLKCFDLTITGTRPTSEAIITLGGVDCQGIVPQTMASRLVPGLYFAGEIIDVAGDTGGYNLQVAFTSGWIAGESAALAFAERSG